MSLFLIKIGKAFAAIKRDGFFRASRRIWQGVKTSLRPVGHGDILFISGGVGDSALYRTTHVAEELQFNGFRCSVTVQDNPFLTKYVDRFSVFVFRRVIMTPRVRAMIAEVKKQGKEIIFETDDLVFDENFKKTDAYHNLNALEKKQYESGVGMEILQDPYVKVVTTTTNFLADKLRTEGKDVFVVSNKLSMKDVKDAEKALRSLDKLEMTGVSDQDDKIYVIPTEMEGSEISRQARNDTRVVRLGYFSGTISHNRDFATITDALIQIMEKYSYTQLLLVGPLDVENILVQRFKERIIQLPYAPRSQHFANIARCDINLAPLVIDDPFCEAKSELKFFEAGIVKVPTVAVANRTFTEAIEDGVDGFVARGTEEWVQKLSQLIEDENARISMGEKAYQTAVERYVTNVAYNREYVQYLFQKIHHVQNIASCDDRLNDVCTAIIIVNWNGKDHLKTCFDSLQKQEDKNFSVIFVDNGSQDGSVELILQNYSNVTIISLKENTGFAYANNIGIQYALFHRNIHNIITLNNDTKLDEQYVASMYDALKRRNGEKIGAIQPRLYNYYQKNIIDSVGVLTSFEFSAHNRGRNTEDVGQFDREEYVFGPSASASLYTRDMLLDTQLSPGEYFDNAYFAYYEDVDLAWRLHLAGYKTLFVPQATVYHVHSATGKNYSPFKSFHIHRNHYFNIIKNASFLRLFGVMLFMPVRYMMLVSSVLFKKGPAAAAQKQKGEGDGLIRIVFRSWGQVIVHMPEICRKRRLIQKKRRISAREIRNIFKKNHISIMDVIYKQYK